jgi:hypothetical protein
LRPFILQLRPLDAIPAIDRFNSAACRLLRRRNREAKYASTRETNSVTNMKLRAELVIDLEAEDYIGAAEHQRFVETIFSELKDRYSQATMSIRQLRDKREGEGLGRSSTPRFRHHTGALAAYEEN